MNELRILAGDKKGASLNLRGGLVSIGSSFSSALFFPDNQLNNIEILLETSNDCLSTTVSSVSGHIKRASGNVLSRGDELVQGEILSLGRVILQYASVGAPWPDDDLVDLGIESEVPQQMYRDDLGGKKYDVKSRSLKYFNLAFITALFLGIGNYAYSNKHGLSDSILSDTPFPSNNNLIGIENEKLNMPVEELKNMVKAREIIGLNVDHNGNNIIVSGILGHVDYEKTQRMMERFNAAFPLFKPIRKYKKATEQLPFSISSIASSPVGRIFVEDHGVVEIGESINGFVLKSVSNSEVVFIGESKLVLKW